MNTLFSEIVHVLYHSKDHSYEEKQLAIQQLQEAPPYDGPWNRALIMALGIHDEEIQHAALESCLLRLDYLDRLNDKAQSNFLGNLIQFCLIERDLESESVRALAMEKTAQKLERDPLKYAHHLRHLLSLAYGMLYTTEQNQVATTTINILKRLADKKETRSDYQTIDKLYFHRRQVVYSDPATQASVLKGFLAQDRELALADLNEETFQAYRSLLMTHIGQDEAREESIALALGNLHRWLALLPQTLEARVQRMNDLERAANGDEPQDLHLNLHLMAHFELLTGKDREDDLVNILVNRYTEPKYKNTLEIGLDVLACLPELRTRMEDELPTLYNKLIAQNNMYASLWQKVFELMGSLIVGLPETLPFTRRAEDENRPEEENQRIAKRLERIRKVRHEMLQKDSKLRQFLNQFSHRQEIPQNIRLMAWKTLLLTLPHRDELASYYQDGLSLATWSDPAKRDFFWETLRIAAETYQRQAWELLMPHWSYLVTPSPDRKETIQKLAEAFGRLRNYSAVAPRPDGITPPLITLAFDTDADVKQIAEKAIYAAGYSKELEREKKRRHILEKSDKLAATRHQIVLHEEERNHIMQQIGRKNDEVHVISFEVQLRKQRYQVILTEAYLETARLTIESQKVHNALVDELKRGERKEDELHQLADRIQQEMGKMRVLENALNNLVGRFEESKKKLESWHKAIAALNRQIEQQKGQIESNRGNISALQTVLRLVEDRQPPFRPSSTGDPGRDRHILNEFEQTLRNFQQQKEDEITQLKSNIKQHERDIKQNQSNIKQNEYEISRNTKLITDEEFLLQSMKGEIINIQRQQQDIEEKRSRLDQQFRQSSKELEEIQQTIANLRWQYQQIQDKNHKHQQETRHGLEQQQREINGLRHTKEQIIAEINRFSHIHNDLTDQTYKLNIIAQDLHQDIEASWDSWHRISAEARQENAQSEQSGLRLEDDTRIHAQNEQESLFWYACEISRARHYHQPEKPKTKQKQVRETRTELERA